MGEIVRVFCGLLVKIIDQVEVDLDERILVAKVYLGMLGLLNREDLAAIFERMEIVETFRKGLRIEVLERVEEDEGDAAEGEGSARRAHAIGGRHLSAFGCALDVTSPHVPCLSVESTSGQSSH